MAAWAGTLSAVLRDAITDTGVPRKFELAPKPLEAHEPGRDAAFYASAIAASGRVDTIWSNTWLLADSNSFRFPGSRASSAL